MVPAKARERLSAALVAREPVKPGAQSERANSTEQAVFQSDKRDRTLHAATAAQPLAGDKQEQGSRVGLHQPTGAGQEGLRRTLQQVPKIQEYGYRPAEQKPTSAVLLSLIHI